MDIIVQQGKRIIKRNDKQQWEGGKREKNNGIIGKPMNIRRGKCVSNTVFWALQNTSREKGENKKTAVERSIRECEDDTLATRKHQDGNWNKVNQECEGDGKGGKCYREPFEGRSK